MSKKRVYIRPDDPASPAAEEEALEALVKWGMDCKADFDRRTRLKKRKGEAERGSSAPRPPAPIAVKGK